jgi:hypothetical protein
MTAPQQPASGVAAAAALALAAYLGRAERAAPGTGRPQDAGPAGLVVDGLRRGAAPGDRVRWDLDAAVGLVMAPGVRCCWQQHPADHEFALLAGAGPDDPEAWFFSARLPAAQAGVVIPFRRPARAGQR